MSFEQHLQQWVTIDNQMKLLNDRMKELRDKKNTLSENINEHIETSNLSNSSVKSAKQFLIHSISNSSSLFSLFSFIFSPKDLNEFIRLLIILYILNFFSYICN